jgi:hypothetical protein
MLMKTIWEREINLTLRQLDMLVQDLLAALLDYLALLNGDDCASLYLYIF